MALRFSRPSLKASGTATGQTSAHRPQPVHSSWLTPEGTDLSVTVKSPASPFTWPTSVMDRISMLGWITPRRRQNWELSSRAKMGSILQRPQWLLGNHRSMWTRAPPTLGLLSQR